jgi:hypothetical protein
MSESSERYDQIFTDGKKFAQDKALELMNEVIAEYESQKPKNSDSTCSNWKQWQAQVNALKFAKSWIKSLLLLEG